MDTSRSYIHLLYVNWSSSDDGTHTHTLSYRDGGNWSERRACHSIRPGNTPNVHVRLASNRNNAAAERPPDATHPSISIAIVVFNFLRQYQYSYRLPRRRPWRSQFGHRFGPSALGRILRQRRRLPVRGRTQNTHKRRSNSTAAVAGRHCSCCRCSCTQVTKKQYEY